MVRKILYFFLIYNIFQNLFAQKQMILSSDAMMHWVRTTTSSMFPSKDAVLAGHSLILIELPAELQTVSIQQAILHCYISRVHQAGSLHIYEVVDTTWQPETKPDILYQWPVSTLLYSENIESPGRISVNILTAIQKAIGEKRKFLCLKFESGDIVLNSPSCEKQGYKPYVQIEYTGNYDYIDVALDVLQIKRQFDNTDPFIIQYCLSNHSTIHLDSIALYTSTQYSEFPCIMQTDVDTMIGLDAGESKIIEKRVWSSVIPDTFFGHLDPNCRIEEYFETNNTVLSELTPSDTGQYQQNFESGMGVWYSDSEVPYDLNIHGPRQSLIQVKDSIQFNGDQSIQVYLDGRSDDGLVWIERKFNVHRDSEYQLNLSFQLHSPSQSDFNNWFVVASMDTFSPDIERDFQITGTTNMVAGWKEYSISKSIHTGESDYVWVALGISATWESERTYYIDEIDVKIDRTAPVKIQSKLNNIYGNSDVQLEVFPNPGNASVQIQLNTSSSMHGTLRIFDTKGRFVCQFIQKHFQSGVNIFQLQKLNQHILPSGIYYLVFQTIQNKKYCKKFTLIK